MQNVLITGAASGIGAATARVFHAKGWRVGLMDLNEEDVQALAHELGDAWYQRVDVTDEQAVTAAVAAFAESCNGRLRLLLNAAGIMRFGRFESLAASEQARIIDINVNGIIYCCHAAYPYLKVTPQAQIINMGSASALYGVPELASYSASKFAVRGLTEALELEWRDQGIRVADLMPIFVRTPMVNAQTYEPAIFRRMGVNLKAEEIAEAIWKQTQSRWVHRPKGGLFQCLYWLSQCSPSFMNRWVTGLLSRPFKNDFFRWK